ncbi:hypothetical protein [Neptunomonas antarctica]|uniref:Uncharacterized protein n=1 Tax=Neptunomonas antarctica TaxID=619304 RepID=A0A1N7MQG7_9GAMM|nr:hypothetical protein [Neptunomonas antarctica]SIS88300.1 hypothetical protein SAMN05421760_106266 [Neptunomonas antarctica]
MSTLNKQNAHILSKLQETQTAVANLVKAGMTVTHISIEGCMPRINLQHAPRNTAMQVCWKAIRPRKTGGRECEMAAIVNGCEVRWTEENH